MCAAKHQFENCHLQRKDLETSPRLTHFIWGVLSQQEGKRTSRKQKIHAPNNQGKLEACSVTPLTEFKKKKSPRRQRR